MGPNSQQLMLRGDIAKSNAHRRYSQGDEVGSIYRSKFADPSSVNLDCRICEEIDTKRFAQTFEFERLDLWHDVGRESARSAKRARMRIQHLELEIAYLSAGVQLLRRSGGILTDETVVVSGGRAMIKDHRRGGSVCFASLRALIEVDEYGPRYQLRRDLLQEMLFNQVSLLKLDMLDGPWGNTTYSLLPMLGNSFIRLLGKGSSVAHGAQFEAIMDPGKYLQPVKYKEDMKSSLYRRASTGSASMTPGM